MKKFILLILLICCSICLSSCYENYVSDNPPIKEILEELNIEGLEYNLLQSEDDCDFSNHFKISGNGGYTILDARYNDYVENENYQINSSELPEEYILYGITNYPDYINRIKYITRVEISDPNVYILGLNINSSFDEAKEVLLSLGYTIDDDSRDRLCMVKGRLNFIFGHSTNGNHIILRVHVNNTSGIKF